eukprot:gene11020-biopygen8005
MTTQPVSQTTPLTEEERLEQLKVTIEQRMKPYDQLLASKILTEVAYAAHKNRVIQSAVEEYQAEPQKTENVVQEIFTSEEIRRMPWIKELLNQQDLWKRHEAAVAANPEDWENNARQTYMAKASNQSLSPLLALIGQYLLFFNDSEDGRRRLVEILFLQDADQRLKIHNWYMLCTAGHGKAVKEGHKVDRLQVPLFPWSDHVLRELNTKMLDAVASVGSLEGGEYP